MAKVSVIIPFLNRQHLLPKAIRSVFNQTYQDWKLILVDDHSTDDYLPGIQAYLKDPRVSLIQNARNLGQSRSLNKALKVVDTPYFVQLDSDDWFYRYTLDTLVKEADKQPSDVAVISGNWNVVWEDAAGTIKRQKLKKGRSFSDRYEFLLANTNLVPRFYRTSALKKMGGWPTNDPHQGRYREDMLILYRLIENYSFYWINKPLYNQRVHANNLTRSSKRLYETVGWSVRNALRRWGNEYTPVFYVTQDGWRKVGKLIPTSNLAKKKMKVNRLSADEMRRMVRSAIRKKSALCLASLAHVRAVEEASLLKNIRFWKLLRGKRIVLISKWSEGFMKQCKPLCKKWNIKIVKSVYASNKNSKPNIMRKLKHVKYDVAFISTDFNAVNICKTIMINQNKIIVDLKDGMLQVNKGRITLPLRKRRN